MADNDDIDGFSFGDFTFAPASPPLSQSHAQPHINGGTSTSAINNDDDDDDDIWGDFIVTPKSSSSSQFNFSNNGFSNSGQPTSGFPSIRVDLDPGKSIKGHNGALPLSLFGEVEEEEGKEKDGNFNDNNGWFDPNPVIQNGSIGNDNNKVGDKSGNGSGLDFDGLALDTNKNGNFNNGLFDPNPVTSNGSIGVDFNKVGSNSGNGSGFDFDGLGIDLIFGHSNDKKKKNDDDGDGDGDGEDDEWEFQGAIFGNGVKEEGNSKEQGGDVVAGSKVESLPMMNQEKQAGQDAFSSIYHKPTSISFMPQSSDFFSASFGNGANDQSSEMDVSFKSTTSTTNGFMWDPFSGVENAANGSGTIGNGSGIIGNDIGLVASSVNENDDFDDFGDFVDASPKVASKEQEQVVAHTNSAEAQLSNGEVKENKNLTGHSRGALPLSLFSDDAEESSDSLDLQNEVAHTPTCSPGNSFSGQNSVDSIHDLISNLYSQAPLTSSVVSTGKPAENWVISSPLVSVTTPLDGDDDWDDGSWEFKSASTESGVTEQLSTTILGSVAQKQSEYLPELQDYIDFYKQLRDSLCFLLQCQLDELKEAQISDAVTGNVGKAEALDDEIQETFKFLESIISSDVLLKKDLQRNNCLSNSLEVLKEPKFNMIESEFSLLKRLQLAANEWKIASELLKHAISMLKILSLGSADEQLLYASTWSNIINICVQELRHGASIWKRALENNVQHQILSDSRGQQYIQALGEIYKVAELLRLSAKAYKPWILLRVSDSSHYFGVLDECGALWSNSGLEESVQSLSDNVDFGCSEIAKSFIASIKNIHDMDLVGMHDRVFIQHKSICHLSLLPQEMLADLKTVIWGEKAYFLNLANLWANLISRDPPQLPHLQVK